MKESWTLSVPEALNRLRQEKINLLDVRSRQEFEQTHLPEAFCIPLDELPQRLSELDPTEKILIYCHRGIRSAHAVSFLREQGFLHAYHIEGGLTQITHFLSEHNAWHKTSANQHMDLLQKRLGTPPRELLSKKHIRNCGKPYPLFIVPIPSAQMTYLSWQAHEKPLLHPFQPPAIIPKTGAKAKHARSSVKPPSKNLEDRRNNFPLVVKQTAIEDLPKKGRNQWVEKHPPPIKNTWLNLANLRTAFLYWGDSI